MAERIRLMDEKEMEQVSGGAYTGSVFVYTVQEGDRLSVLAQRFGTSVSVEDNCLSFPVFKRECFQFAFHFNPVADFHLPDLDVRYRKTAQAGILRAAYHRSSAKDECLLVSGNILGIHAADDDSFSIILFGIFNGIHIPETVVVILDVNDRRVEIEGE